MKLEALQPKSTTMGRRVSFTCESYEGDDVKFSWTRNGAVLRSSNNIVIASSVASSTLTILKTRASDAGQYTCIASNKLSEDRVTGSLDVEGELNAHGHCAIVSSETLLAMNCSFAARFLSGR